MLVDSHCHLDLIEDEGFNLSEIMSEAKTHQVDTMLTVSTTLSGVPRLLKYTEQYEHVFTSVGLHPNEHEKSADIYMSLRPGEQGESGLSSQQGGQHEPTLSSRPSERSERVERSLEPTVEDIVQLGKHPKILAVGETGLDYFRSEGDLEWQRDRFRHHIAAAKELKKPLIIHTRQAKEDTLKLMQEEGVQEIGGVMHCFSEDWDTAKAAMDLGFYISFSGVVTFKNAKELQEVAKQVPLDRILVETDAPYLAPTPFRGKRNQPAYVYHTAKFIADLREMPLEQLAEVTTQNFKDLFLRSNYVISTEVEGSA